MGEACEKSSHHGGDLELQNRDLQLALDSLGRGLLVLDAAGCVTDTYSRPLRRWFGEPERGGAFWRLLERLDPRAGCAFQLNWEQLLEDILPAEVALDQLPRTVDAVDRRYELHYTPHFEDGRVRRLVVVVSDVTDRWTAEQAHTEQRDVIHGFEHAMCDRMGFLEFFDDANSLVHRLCSPGRPPLAEVRRWLHTLKGNASLFGLKGLAAFCHALEDEMARTDSDLRETERKALKGYWDSFAGRIGSLLGATDQGNITLDDGQYDALVGALRDGRPNDEIVQMVASWRLELARDRLARHAAYACALSERLGRGTIEASVEAGTLRLSREIMVPFWGVFAHAVRNAVAHGLEPAEERRAAGKSENGRLRMAAWRTEDRVFIEVADDGRGIDWDAVRSKAREAWLPAETAADLEAALFTDGLSTNDSADAVAGRGVGMGALRAECENLDGRIHVTSTPGMGTTVLFTFPATTVADDDARTDWPSGVCAVAKVGDADPVDAMQA
jgi:HPt (histidine-containing phosphotransfer) domain-containing protein/two-component sensor histidine kinase